MHSVVILKAEKQIVSELKVWKYFQKWEAWDLLAENGNMIIYSEALQRLQTKNISTDQPQS